MSESGPSIIDPSQSSDSSGRGRGRGRGKSRGGLGKYLRARGRGHGLGRPAEFHKRLLLEGEAPDEEEDEDKEERLRKYSRRQLGTNADRYKEEEPELGSDGEPIVEPEVDLSTFLARQKLNDDQGTSTLVHDEDEDDEDIDHSLDQITSGYRSGRSEMVDSRKGKVQEISWDNELDELSLAKETADAARDLKFRFRAKSEKLKAKPTIAPARDRKLGTNNCALGAVIDAPPLPLPENAKLKSQKEEMEDFLDDLLG
ncbi:hypothetical protein L218DRAFT_882881 [Marasmius fiardii PR-910]|nr:hypothetical protein L218DRAFT_882881 [Marasmius fiardii PR-910]